MASPWAALPDCSYFPQMSSAAALGPFSEFCFSIWGTYAVIASLPSFFPEFRFVFVCYMCRSLPSSVVMHICAHAQQAVGFAF